MLIGLVGGTCVGKDQFVLFLKQHYQFTSISIANESCPSNKKLADFVFENAEQVNNHVIKQWTQPFIVMNLEYTQDWKILLKRPFFLLISLDSRTISHSHHD